MPFNSIFFILAFLPVTVAVFFALSGRKGLALGWLVAASLLFCGGSEPVSLAVLLCSTVANHGFALAIQRTEGARRRHILVAGVVCDLGLLAWWKYTGFLFESLASFGWVGSEVAAEFVPLTLPLAISFFTFQQIAYLVETHQGLVRETRFLHYLLFIAFFPKLIAGPIVHHSEIMDQLDTAPARRFDPADLAVGLTLFAFGLFKKVVLADGIGARANPLFTAAALGIELSFLEAWVAALAYTFQVYFDFSGYTDMALGAARCFGIVLPLNFFSPYKATNIAEFWRRWHVTLTRWLRLYLFVPISRRLMRRGDAWEGIAVFVAQLVTMLLCGLWHGAGYGFVVWGGVHGLLLLGHDGWVKVKTRFALAGALPAPLGIWLGRALLLLVLASTFVVFRAENLSVAWQMLESMAFGHGLALGPESAALAERIAPFVPGGVTLSEIAGQHASATAFLHLLLLLAIVWGLPNTLELLAEHRPALDVWRFSSAETRARAVGPPAVETASRPRLSWRPSIRWAVLTLVAFTWSLYALLVEGYEEFVYRFF